MAAITRLGPAGITMRRTTFVGVPAEPTPFPVALSRGGFFSDVLPVIQHVAPIRILLLDELRVISDARIISPPQTYSEAVTILLQEGFFSSPGEQFIDGENNRRAKRLSMKWLGISKPDSDDPFGVFKF